MTGFVHIPVLLHEVLEYLRCERGGSYLDCTLGGGGHAAAIAAAVCPEGKVVGIDRDTGAIATAAERLSEFGNCIILLHGNFADIDALLRMSEVRDFDGILMDLGFSSMQVDDGARGFSFLRPGPLDMRMDTTQELTAREIVNFWSEEEIGAVLREYGEERYWKRIARGIVSARCDGVVDTTDKLTGIVLASIPGVGRRQPIHPSTRVFQALRIAVNAELKSLEEAVPKAVEFLKPGGRLVVISYHSLEDRIVKRAFAGLAKGCICPPDFPVCKCGRKPTVQLITRRVIRAGSEEVRSNPRARSAKMRVCRKRGAEEQKVFVET